MTSAYFFKAAFFRSKTWSQLPLSPTRFGPLRYDRTHIGVIIQTVQAAPVALSERIYAPRARSRDTTWSGYDLMPKP